MKSPTSRPQGQLVADFLVGSWRATQAPLDISLGDLERVTTLLYNSGGTGLGWWRIHESDLKSSPCGELLHQGYRLQALQTPINEQRIVKAYQLLRGAAIEPILIKGWSAARFYPHRTLRSYGDIDLVVRATEYSTAREVLKQDEAWWVDLHKGLPVLDDRSVDGLFERSQLVALQGIQPDVQVRVLSDEDHLALLAIHLIKHSAWRPSWLCDIAAMVEALPAGFDADVCFGSKKQRAAWIAAAISLAHELLGANVEKIPTNRQAKDLPDWLVDSVLKQWGNLFRVDHVPVQPRPLISYSFHHPKRLFREILARWPDPIVATYNLRCRPNSLPRLPYQVGAMAAGAGRYLIDHLGRAVSWQATEKPIRSK